MKDMTRFAFGATSAIMTSMALIVGLGSANLGRSAVIGGLLIIAIADNLSDTLGIHIYEECKVGGGGAVRTSVSNYLTRLITSCSFVLIALMLPLGVARWVGVVWGAVLLSVLTYLIARSRSVKPVPEVALHLLVASAVVILSQVIGSLIARFV